VLSSQAVDRRSRIAASLVLLVSAIVFVLLLPFAKVQLSANPVFVPLNQAVLIVNDLVTATLLLFQLRVTRSRALLVLACAYLFSAAMAVMHLLSFPGVFAGHGVLGGGAQTTAYLYVFWHSGFALLAMGYVAMKHRESAASRQRRSPRVGAALGFLLLAVAALVLAATAGHEAFPPLLDGRHYSAGFNIGRYGQWFLTAAAIVMLWRSAPQSVLDQWLFVVLCAWFIEIALVAIFNAGRYDVGFYAGRVYALLASCCLLALLLWEQARLYSGILVARETARSEAELRANRDVLRLAMLGGHMGAWSADLGTRRTWWSAELAEIVGHRGRGFASSIRAALKLVHPADRRSLWKEVTAVLERHGDFASEFRFRHGGGEWRWLSLRGHAVFDPQDRAVSLYGIGTDTTEKHRSEEAAQVVEAGFQALANGIPLLAWMARPDGWIYWYNQRWYDYTRVAPDVVEGWGWQAFHDPSVLPEVLERWRRSIATGTPFEMVLPLRGADGEYRTFLTRATPFKDSEGNVLHWFGSHTDITAQRELEMGLRLAERRKDEFLATLAHELRNPLAPIRNAITILKLVPSLPPQVERVRDIVDRQSNHLSRLVEELLEVSRIGQGKVQLRKARMSVLDALRDAVEATRPAMHAARHELAVDVPEEGMSMEADSTRLTQVFVNLLNNAAKFTPAGGRVSVSARRCASWAEVVVRDNGIGIPADQLDSIFGIFSQVGPARERSQGGLGIGLALVRGLVELHGGSVQARSAGEQQGSEFVVRLPIEAGGATPG
jgi:PAS domain S-box-containing protein